MSNTGNGEKPSGDAADRMKRKRRKQKRNDRSASPPGPAATAQSGPKAPSELQERAAFGEAVPAQPGDAARRRKRRRRGKGAVAGVVGEAPVQLLQPAAGEQPERDSGQGANGGHGPVAMAANGPEISVSTTYPGAATHVPGSGKRRRNRRRRQAANGSESTRLEINGPNGAGQGGNWHGSKGGDPAQRHMRAPVRPAPDASFDPARAANAAAPAAGTANGANQQARLAKSPAAHRRDGSRPVFAALDLGTNNCRLLIAAPDGPQRFKVVDAYSRIVRLGEGLASSGRLQHEAMQRAIDALVICSAKLNQHRVAGKRLIATEACRAAENGVAFLAEVRQRTGLELEIIDRQTEARLAAEGCGSLMDPAAHGAVLFDIGGGSTELVLVRRQQNTDLRISGQIAGWTSLPVGVVNLSERHGGRDVGPEVFAAMVNEVAGHIGGFDGRHALADIWHPANTHLLGTSGTVTTIAGVHLELLRYDRQKVDGIWLGGDEIDRVIGDLCAMDYEARSKNPCIGRERADLVLAGCAILEAIRQTWPSPRLRVADRGLREGILNELMHDAGVWRRQRWQGGWNKMKRKDGRSGAAEGGA